MIKIVNTGGTFSKVYNPITGELEVRDDLISFLKEIVDETLMGKNYNFKYYQIIGKDSLDINDEDRKNLLNFVNNLDGENVLIIHGTDTIDKSAEVLSSIKNKKIILTGALKPYSYNKVEATANFAQSVIAFNFIQKGVYISLNGVIDNYKNVVKNREKGYFKIKNINM